MRRYGKLGTAGLFKSSHRAKEVTMRLSPLDVEHQDFDGALSGYNKRQVREFLARAGEALEGALDENKRLRDQMARQEETIGTLQLAEAEMKRAVIAAERIGNELKQNAKREAEIIIQEAEATKHRLIREAEDKVGRAETDLERLKREKRLFGEQFRGLLNAYERSLDTLGAQDVTDQKTSAEELLEADLTDLEFVEAP